MRGNPSRIARSLSVLGWFPLLASVLAVVFREKMAWLSPKPVRLRNISGNNQPNMGLTTAFVV